MSHKKVREIGLSNLSLTGNIYSAKANEIVNFESSLERDYIYLLEYDTKVYKYYEQPLKIYYGNNQYYVPDFFVKYHSKDVKSELIEVKYLIDLAENKEKYRPKFEAAQAFCSDNGLKFKIITEEKIRNGYRLQNAKFLLGYRNPKVGFDDGFMTILEKIIENHQPISIQETLDLAITCEEKKAELLYVLLHMLSKRYINFDETTKLTMDTTIFLE
ncbi:TnsA endonuclease N-terminal domain-containing protein [Chryseobacterium sp. S0630]|uniref:TnsA endonuclease N-terminal domain-containing protein n=1 Tax=Chryseobacterium sp. S0630 TaxID=2957803 RepID=UPI0020A184DF|nr:TnsA endonuclease N-terminal domain-containing protein [Chryseobacterium sp. S0630]MCP1297620.1 TnsA endonuclease N-terminal domain-containing protein [Chryseobacterium sp. S0630]